MADKLIDIEGIGAVQAVALATVGLKTTDDLLAAAGSPSGRAKVAAAIGVTESQVLEWVNRADLMRLKGVGSEFSDLLENAGVDSVKELAQRVPVNLHAELAEVNATRKLTRRTPSVSQVEEWVAEARSLQVPVETAAEPRVLKRRSRASWLGVALASVAVVVGAYILLPGDGPPPPPPGGNIDDVVVGAAVLTGAFASCGSTATVTFTWQPSEGSQWLDLSTVDSSFAPGTFISSAEIPSKVGTLKWPGIEINTRHYWRINTLTRSGWQSSAGEQFVACPIAPPPPPPESNRANCAAIRGTAYLSETERIWFVANCSAPPSSQSGQRVASSYIGSYNPPSDFCSFAPCIPSFWEGGGFVIQCRDGLYSKSGGISGSCSSHGGNGITSPSSQPPVQQAPAVVPPTASTGSRCDPSYPTVCIPPYPPDLDCGQIPYRRFTVIGADPHRFDSDKDGIGCE